MGEKKRKEDEEEKEEVSLYLVCKLCFEIDGIKIIFLSRLSLFLLLSPINPR